MSIVSFLKEWKEIIGALIGGLLGVVAALLVARDARKREQRVAAMSLLIDFIEIREAAKSLREMIEKSKVKEQERVALTVNALVDLGHPKTSNLFEGHLGAVQLANSSLAAHVALFSKIYRAFERSISELELVSKGTSASNEHQHKCLS